MTGSGDIAGSFGLDISDRAPPEWPELMERDPAAEYTHSQHWTESVCGQLPAAEALWLSLRRAGELVAGLNTVVSVSGRRVLGFSQGAQRLDSSYEGTSGGPVIAGDLDNRDRDLAFGILVDALGSQPTGLLGSCAMVLSPAQEKRFGHLLLGRPGWVRHDATTAVVSLDGGIERVEADRLVMNKRNERNRGLRRGAEVFTTSEPELLREYYGIYDQAARHWGIEAVPQGLLQGLLADGEDRVFFTCVRLEGKVIGGHLNLHYRDRVLAWNGVTDPRYARTHFPATLCFWGDLVEACRRGAEWLDFGGSGSVGSLDGFKKYFGAELQMRGLYVRDSSLVNILRKGRRLWRKTRSASTSRRWHDPRTGSGDGGRS